LINSREYITNGEREKKRERKLYLAKVTKSLNLKEVVRKITRLRIA